MSFLNKFGLGPGNGPSRDVSHLWPPAAGAGDKSRTKSVLPAAAGSEPLAAPLPVNLRVSRTA